VWFGAGLQNEVGVGEPQMNADKRGWGKQNE
jgi:hypothetical protein